MIRAAALSLLMAGPAMACPPDEVDTRLVLVADVSLSMDDAERKIQRDGYADAFLDSGVLDAIQGGYCGRIAVAYVEFADRQQLLMDWVIVETDEDAFAVSELIRLAPHQNLGPQTGIAAALDFAGALLDAAPVTALQSVIDLGADGVDNIGGQTKASRDRLTTATAENGWQAVTINGLALTGGAAISADALSQWFKANVVGGPRSALYTANGPADLPRVVRMKIADEIS